MFKSKQSKAKAAILSLVLIIILNNCGRKVYVRQLPSFEPAKMNSIAVFTDFISVKGDTIYIERSKKLGNKLAGEISDMLIAKKYKLSSKPIFSVGSYFEGSKKIFDETNQNSIGDAPFYIDDDIIKEDNMRKALISSFKEIDKELESIKGKKIEKELFYRTDIFIGENARLLGQYCGADTLLFLYTLEKKKTSLEKSLSSLKFGLIAGLSGVAQTKLIQTDTYKPKALTWGAIYSAIGFLLASTLLSDAYIAGYGVIIEAESGRATWYNFSRFNSGGVIGDVIEGVALELLKEFPEKK